MISRWSATPRGRRVLADLAHALCRQKPFNKTRIALLIGAGVDHALTGRPRWAGFLEEIAKASSLPHSEHNALTSVANDWPVELAEALRIAVGRVAYQKAVVSITKELPLHGGKSNEMCRAIKGLKTGGVRLIITFNYTRDILKAVDAPPVRTIVIQRTHLGAWTKHDLMQPSANVHLIAIHGIVDPHSTEDFFPILDRQSYDQALFSDLHYTELLQRVLQDYTVLSIGLSWNDVALRNAAARVHYASPISGGTHVAIFSRATKTGDPTSVARGEIPLKADLWRERSMVAAYSVRPLYYNPEHNHIEATTILNELPKLARTIQNAPNVSKLRHKVSLGSPRSRKIGGKQVLTLSAIADLLDSCGDYESLFQREWFAKNWEQLKATLLDSRARRLSGSEWAVMARIERHLRHFLFIYEASSSRERVRRQVWNAVAGRWEYLREKEKVNLWEETVEHGIGPSKSFLGRGLYEFAIGAYEVFGDNDCGRIGRYWRRRLESAGGKMASRVSMAQKIWLTSTANSPTTLFRLRCNAIEYEWEAIEAKIALDICQYEFRRANRRRNKSSPRKFPEKVRKELLRFAVDAREAGRIAGCGRRELGAVAFGSLVSDIEIAEADLVGILHGFSTRTEAGAGPTGDWDIYVGLLATMIDRQSGSRPIDWRFARTWIEERCGEIKLSVLPASSVIRSYWKDYHPEAADLALRIAKGLAKVEPGVG